MRTTALPRIRTRLSAPAVIINTDEFDPDQERDEGGRWTTGGGGGAVAETIRESIVKKGGESIQPSTKKRPSAGFMVSKPGLTHRVPEAKFKSDKVFAKQTVKDYMKKNAVHFDDDKVYLGAWVSDGEVWFDVSENTNVDEAMLRGYTRNERAIWDVMKKEEINLGEEE